MQLYAGMSEHFIRDTAHNQIADKLKDAFFRSYRYHPSPAEVSSWRNSLRADAFRPHKDLFVAQVVGESMNRRIPNGYWCLFQLAPGGTREGKVVLVQRREIHDADAGGHFTVKVYQSEKANTEDGRWQHGRIVLRADTMTPGYNPMELSGEEASALKVVAELVAVLG